MKQAAAALAVVCLGIAAASPARAAIDWSTVPGKDFNFFYPGQSSYEWTLTQSDMSGAEQFRTRGTTCGQCHIGEEPGMGQRIVAAQPRTYFGGVRAPLEAPQYLIPGKPGGISGVVKFANDGTTLYAHIEFREGSQPDAEQDTDYATKVTIMFNAGKVVEFRRMGCWAFCHDDSATNASSGGTNRTIYLPRTRAQLTRHGGGDALKPAAELAAMKADGQFLEYWQARLNPGAKARAADGVVFDQRTEVLTFTDAEGTYTNGTWSVTLSGRMDPGNGMIRFVPGQLYQFGIAIHAGHTGWRFHYISFMRTLAIDGGDADLVAVRR